MDNKDYITIFNEDGTAEEMEVIATFKLEETKKACIIYKGINSNDTKYFAASYDEDNEYSDLNTEFTEKEKEELNEILKTILTRGENNA